MEEGELGDRWWAEEEEDAEEGVGQKEGLVLEEEGRRKGSSMQLPNYPTVSNENKTDRTGAH